MLKDWLWSFVITASILMELGGWSVVLRRTVFRRFPLRPTLVWALAVALAAETYFTLSLFSTSGHVLLLVAGIFALLAPRLRRSNERKLHLRLARFFSPMSWRRAWPWLLLPLAWSTLRLTDSLLPNPSAAPLAIHLLAPHQWLETGRQLLDPMQPLGAAASVWEGLYFHVLAIAHALSSLHRPSLVRAQITCQLLHFILGQCLTLVILADLITPLVRTGWDALVHSVPSRLRRHQLGMATVVAVPSSVFFAWLACAQPAVDWSGTLAQHNWGTALFVFASLATLYFAFSAPPSTLGGFRPRIALAGFFAGTAVAIDSSALLCFPGFFLAAGVIEYFFIGGRRLGSTLSWIAGCAAALAPWLYRNRTQAGAWIYPPPFAWRLPIDTQPGWLSSNWASLVGEAYAGGAWGTPMRILVVIGAAGFVLYVWRRSRQQLQWRLVGLIVFTLATALSARVLGAPNGWVSFVPISVVLCAALGAEFLLSFRPALASRLARWVPLGWCATALLTIQLPWHVLWQNLSLALTPTTTYLANSHSHFTAKQWTSLHLPSNARIAWTWDDRFYYLDQYGAAIPDSRLLHHALLKASTPVERVKALCELGFNVLAWEENRRGSEATGLLTYLQLTDGAVLHTSDDVILLNLMPSCH